MRPGAHRSRHGAPHPGRAPSKWPRSRRRRRQPEPRPPLMLASEVELGLGNVPSAPARERPQLACGRPGCGAISPKGTPNRWAELRKSRLIELATCVPVYLACGCLSMSRWYWTATRHRNSACPPNTRWARSRSGPGAAPVAPLDAQVGPIRPAVLNEGRVLVWADLRALVNEVGEIPESRRIGDGQGHWREGGARCDVVDTYESLRERKLSHHVVDSVARAYCHVAEAPRPGVVPCTIDALPERVIGGLPKSRPQCRCAGLEQGGKIPSYGVSPQPDPLAE